VSSIDMTNAGAVTVTPPAVGLCSGPSTDQVVLLAPYAAPWKGTGLRFAGPATPARLRSLIATPCLSRPTTAQREFAVAGVSVQHTSSTPGDLPPEDPLS
jgi:hypothetical protein